MSTPPLPLTRSAPSLALAMAVSGALGGFLAAPAAGQGTTRVTDASGAVLHGWIGINLQAIEQHGPEGVRSLLVIRDVVEGSPADQASLRPGDRIVRLNGQPVTFESFARLANRLRPGDRFQVTLVRDHEGWEEGWERQVTIRASARPARELVALSGELVFRVDSALQRLRVTGGNETPEAVRGGSGESLPLVGTAHLRTVGPDSTRTFIVYSTGHLLPPASGSARAGNAAAGSPEGGAWRFLVPDSGTAGRERTARTMIRSRGPEGATARRPPVTVRTSADTLAAAFRPLAPLIAGQNRVAGAGLTPLNPQLASYFGVSTGLLVIEVPEGTPAADAGLVPGDVVVGVEETRVTSVDELRTRLSRPGRDALELEVVRQGRRVRLTLRR